MLHDQDLHISLWAEASSTAVYCHHALLKDKTLEELFSGSKPDVSHLRVFGCPVYVHVLKDKRSKFETSGRKGVFVGYSETSKAYKIYFPGQRQIEFSRDVAFNEEVSFWKAKEIPAETY